MDNLKNQQNEKYTFVQILIPYDQRYSDNMENQQKQINAALDKFLLKIKPSSYRIINAQLVFLPETDQYGLSTSATIQHVLHIAYT
ncbi:hypothetical protein ADIARSV_3505 [Arcticibacter svalbardensis MN12-7]|uniref:Uncharacterized protein n=1 Tax=Arcticibacter svalbardensis MN12-7 TaxID=1150600 RepID=R9GNY3_9SPHI|nr:hypothetical protein [Arcticibacter svalbardensis]EOR93426.1 hypothetical protein ADIARSV_3505 [Arcticibacter svalbardensis MN12-7]